MGKHTIHPARSRARTPLLGAAAAIGGICVALATAGTADAKTHHGNGPGNAFGNKLPSGPAPTSYAAGTRSSTTSIVIRSSGVSGTTTSINGTTSGANQTATRGTTNGPLSLKPGNRGLGTSMGTGTTTGTATTIGTGTTIGTATTTGTGTTGNLGMANPGAGNTGFGTTGNTDNTGNYKYSGNTGSRRSH